MAKRPKMTPEERAEREEQERWFQEYRDKLWQEIKRNWKGEQSEQAGKRD